MDLVSSDDPILKTPCAPVPHEDIPGLAGFASELLAVMVKKGGMGIAAPQVGSFLRLCIVQKDRKPLVMINPAITGKGKRLVVLPEGCLSYPGIQVRKPRLKEVGVSYFDLNGEQHYTIFQGIESVCAQHEIDHLNGITIK